MISKENKWRADVRKLAEDMLSTIEQDDGESPECLREASHNCVVAYIKRMEKLFGRKPTKDEQWIYLDESIK